MSKRTALTRDAIVRSIARIFRKYGYEGASMSLLSDETGLSKSSLYHHFPNGKEDMANRALDFVGAYFSEILIPEINAAATPHDKLKILTERLAEYYEHGGLGCILAAFSLFGSPETVISRVKGIFDGWIELTASLYRESGATPELAHERAEKAIARLQGALIMTAASHQKKYVDEAFQEMRFPG